MHRRLLLALPLIALVPLAACGDGEDAPAASDAPTVSSVADTEPAAEAPHVVASTTWTGALAALAGATDITVIAPTSILHPPDYDPKPSDLLEAADADLVVFAEFESFAPRLVEAAGGDVETFPVMLENTPAMIETEVMRIAAELGTEDTARAQLDEFLAAVGELGGDLAAQVGDAPTVVVSQVFMAYWADWAGLTSAGTFGPAPMSAGELSDLTDLGPTLIFDNLHVPGGQAFEAAGIARLELVNYPGDDLDLLAVFQHNHDLIAQGLAGEVVADPNVSVPEATGHDHGESGESSDGHDHASAEASGDHHADSGDASTDHAAEHAAVDASALHDLADELNAGTLDAERQQAIVAEAIAALGADAAEAGGPAAELLAILQSLDAALAAGDVETAAAAADAAHDAAHALEDHG